MTFVVGENCIKCKYTDCVEMCPVDCFHEGENMLVIDPEECIDCALCEPECPIGAIYADNDMPASEERMVDVNAKYATEWPVLTEMKPPPADAESWENVKPKYPEHFSSRPGGDEP